MRRSKKCVLCRGMEQRGFWKLDEVADEQLLSRLTELLAADGRSEARIVAHLAELDARRLHLKLDVSLFRYCQRRLGLRMPAFGPLTQN